MYHCYTLADELFSKCFNSHNYELAFEKFKNLLQFTKKNARFLDCFEDGRTNVLVNNFKELRNSLSQDDFLLKVIDTLWIDQIIKNKLNLPKTKMCDCQKCDYNKNTSEIKKFIKDFPHFVLDYCDPNSPIAMNIDESITSPTYKRLFDRTSYEEELLLDSNTGCLKIEKNWGSLIALCKSTIKIMDRNVFAKWRTGGNYENGLLQFANTIMKINPTVELIILTKLAQPETQGVTKEDIKRYIKSCIDQVKSVKISVQLSDSGKFDHDRFILFDDICGAEIGRGLDTFYAAERNGTPKIDRYRIIYYHVDEIETYFANPQRTVIQSGDYQPIRNY